MRKLVIFALLFSLMPMQVAQAQTPSMVAAQFTAETCDRMRGAIKDMELALRGTADELAVVQEQIKMAQSGSAANIDKMVAQSLAEVRTLRKKVTWERKLVESQALTPGHAEGYLDRDEPALLAAEKRLDFWTEKETASLSGGAVTVKGPPHFLDDLKFRERELTESRAKLDGEIADLRNEFRNGNCSEVAATGAKKASSTWSGTWTFVGVNGGAVILQQTGAVVQGHLNVRGQNYPTFTLKISGATATGVADVSGGLGTLGNLTLTIFGKRFTGKYLAGGRSYEPDGYCTAGDCLNNR